MINLKRIGTTVKVHTMTLDRYAIVDVKKARDGSGVDGIVRLGVLMPGLSRRAATGEPNRLPIEEAIEVAMEAAKRGGLTEVLLHDPNNLWPP